MRIRLLMGAGLFAAGYYLGEQTGLSQPLRKDQVPTPAKNTARTGNASDDDRR